ncbi:antitoxin Xre-like helix-turn-helix domain-containing protein [Halomonas sp. NO4]|uniref:antitoxin Xre-like helix-turn-helix domain-containing protein n=1 Tax=Halomonas sp. NO4 TaxID=2484813 RepID=UPI001969FAB5|nr:antitoxin Xre-like helix-turn-helix domain-containing protein [Halomonas sp. NO4]
MAGKLEERAGEGTLLSPLFSSTTDVKKPQGEWPAWFASEGVSDDAFVHRDQILERLKGSVREYDRPFEPVGAEDWEAHDNAAMSAAIMRTMPNIAAEWGLSHVDMAALLGVEMATYRTWLGDPSRAALNPEQAERASLLLGIYKALALLFPPPERQRRWLHQPNQNALFQEVAPIERIRHGGLEGMWAVRRHLDAVCQGGES